jgi:hypothetical protein
MYLICGKYVTDLHLGWIYRRKWPTHPKPSL